MPAWKRTTKKGKFIELARMKAFQKKENQKEIFLYMPLAKKEADGPKKEDFFFFLKKSLSKINL